MIFPATMMIYVCVCVCERRFHMKADSTYSSSVNINVHNELAAYLGHTRVMCTFWMRTNARCQSTANVEWNWGECALPFSMSSPHFFDHARKFFEYAFSISALSCISVCKSVHNLAKAIENQQWSYFIHIWDDKKHRIPTCSHLLFVWWFVCSCPAPRTNRFPPAKADRHYDGTLWPNFLPFRWMMCDYDSNTLCMQMEVVDSDCD